MGDLEAQQYGILGRYGRGSLGTFNIYRGVIGTSREPLRLQKAHWRFRGGYYEGPVMHFCGFRDAVAS